LYPQRRSAGVEAEASRDVQDAVAQALGLCFGELEDVPVAVELGGGLQVNYLR